MNSEFIARIEDNGRVGWRMELLLVSEFAYIKTEDANEPEYERTEKILGVKIVFPKAKLVNFLNNIIGQAMINTLVRKCLQIDNAVEASEDIAIDLDPLAEIDGVNIDD